MSNQLPTKKAANPKPFSRIREAREALLAQAEELIELYIKNAKNAMAAGDYESASNSLKWLIEHIPAQDGVTLIARGIDQGKPDEGNKGPVVQIGIQLGGVTPKELPPAVEVIDIEPNE